MPSLSVFIELNIGDLSQIRSSGKDATPAPRQPSIRLVASSLITSAPMLASTTAAKGPDQKAVRSIILIPSNGNFDSSYSSLDNPKLP